jgi:hypothetical protein
MPRDLARALAVLALLVIAGLGISSLHGAPVTKGVGLHGSSGVVVALGVAVIAVAAVMTISAVRGLIRAVPRKQADDDQVQIIPERNDTLWQRMGALLFALLVVGGAVAAMFAVGRLHLSPATGGADTGSRPVIPSVAATANPVPSTSSHTPSTGRLFVLICAIALLVVVVGSTALWRLRRRTQDSPRQDAVRDETTTAEVLHQAAVALAHPTDPRAGILACYRAMEQRLARAGTAHHVADTPEDLLGRAARSGLLIPESARRLAALFREARSALTR